jgi:hypothetical protein
MTTSAAVEDMAKRIIRAFVQSGARPGDVIGPQTLRGKIYFPVGQIADIPGAMGYAAEQGWLEMLGSDQYRLSDSGFAADS